MIKKETKTKINTLIKYCPLCDEFHSQDEISREVRATLSGRDVTYTEIFYRCDYTNYEIVISRNLKDSEE